VPDAKARLLHELTLDAFSIISRAPRRTSSFSDQPYSRFMLHARRTVGLRDYSNPRPGRILPPANR